MNDNYELEINYRLLTILSKEPDLTQREMARRMGISLGKVNYCLSEMAKKSFLKIHRFKNSKHKRGYMYTLTPKGLEEKAQLTSRFLKRKISEYEEIKEQIKELAQEIDSDLDFCKFCSQMKSIET